MRNFGCWWKKKYQLKSTIKGITLAHENVHHRLYGFRYGWIQELKQCHWNRSSLHLSCLHPPCAGSIYRQVATSSNKMASRNTRLTFSELQFQQERKSMPLFWMHKPKSLNWITVTSLALLGLCDNTPVFQRIWESDWPGFGHMLTSGGSEEE